MFVHTVLFPFERELRFLPQFLHRDRIAIDVGANVGVFTEILARGSKRVIAFEPHPRCAAHLRSLGIRNCDVVETALSDSMGRAALRIPVRAGVELHALGTIAGANNAESHLGADGTFEHSVAVSTLDDVLAARLAQSETVGFIKIDVEGHELAVLKGAVATIERHRPAMLIEIEYRHGAPVDDIFSFLEQRGYRALALLDGRALTSVSPDRLRAVQSDERLARKLAQPRYPGYVNNVFFVPLTPRSLSSPR
jgi:FkbM family methyltransferase